MQICFALFHNTSSNKAKLIHYQNILFSIYVIYTFNYYVTLTMKVF